MASRWTLGC